MHIVAGIMRRTDGTVFMQRRLPSQSFPGCWEFPGGKAEPGETAAQSLARELQEETGVCLRAARPWLLRKTLRGVPLQFFIVEKFDNAPRGREGQECGWFSPMSPPSPLLPANDRVCKWLSLPPVCAVTAAELLGAKETLRRMTTGLQKKQWGMIQLRDKNLPPAERKNLCVEAAALCRRHGALLLANDDDELAALCGGLHLSSRRLAECESRPDFLWAGASCHSAEEVRRAAALDLDFAVLSPVKKTLTHVAARPLGWRGFASIAAASAIPVYALGGLLPADLPQAQSQGAQGIALMRKAWE